MLELQFIDRNTNNVFREFQCETTRNMQSVLDMFKLKEGDECNFFDKELRTLSAIFITIIPYINGEIKGFQLLFDVTIAEKQIEIIYNGKKMN